MSVTDRCNFRCVYCMPPDGVQLTSHENILRLEELADVAQRFVSLFGIDKIRLTGGEPLLRRNIEWLVDKVGRIKGIHDFAMTTNGMLLKSKAEALYSSGLRRINISLDTLRPDRFREITRGGNLDEVLAGIDVASKTGFHPIKVNVVLLPGFDEESEFMEWANQNGYILRFIEMMPGAYWDYHKLTDNAPKMPEIIQQLQKKIGEIHQLDANINEPGQHSIRFEIPLKSWRFEIIPTITNHFCDTCNRIRLDSQGRLRLCLYSNETLDLRPILARPDDEFAGIVLRFAEKKKVTTRGRIGSFMSSIGG